MPQQEGGKPLKERMLEVARELFIKNGYNATTTNDIVKYSGSSKGTLYYHFPTKENLFLEVMSLEDEKWFKLWREEERHCASNTEKFYRFNELSTNSDLYYPLQMAMLEFMSKEHDSKLINDKIGEIDRRYIDQYYDIFNSGNETGEWKIDDPESASRIASAAVGGLMVYIYKTDPVRRKELTDRFSRIFLQGLLNEQPR